jgi:COMPASS component SWD3
MVSGGQDNTVRVYRHIRDSPVTNGTTVKEDQSSRDELPMKQEDVDMAEA